MGGYCTSARSNQHTLPLTTMSISIELRLNQKEFYKTIKRRLPNHVWFWFLWEFFSLSCKSESKQCLRETPFEIIGQNAKLKDSLYPKWIWHFPRSVPLVATQLDNGFPNIYGQNAPFYDLLCWVSTTSYMNLWFHHF